MARSKNRNGFTLSELMVTVAVLGVLAIAGSVGLIRSSRIWGLRSAAVELAGYLENAQAVAAGSTGSCTLAITGNGDAQQIGPTAAANNACANLPPAQLLPSSPIPLALNPATVTAFTLGPRGTLATTVTTVLSAPNTGNTEYCVQLRAPSALVGIGLNRGGTCDYAAFN